MNKRTKGLLFILIPLISISLLLIIFLGYWEAVAIGWGFALVIASVSHGWSILWDIRHKHE
jgi:hypothetical protein